MRSIGGRQGKHSAVISAAHSTLTVMSKKMKSHPKVNKLLEQQNDRHKTHADNSQLSHEMAALSAMALIAAATQGNTNVLKPNEKCTPTSLHMIAVAPSGACKSSVEKYMAALSKWKKQKKSLNNSIRKGVTA